MKYHAVPVREVFDVALGWRVADDAGNTLCACDYEEQAALIASALSALDAWADPNKPVPIEEARALARELQEVERKLAILRSESPTKGTT